MLGAGVVARLDHRDGAERRAVGGGDGVARPGDAAPVDREADEPPRDALLLLPDERVAPDDAGEQGSGAERGRARLIG